MSRREFPKSVRTAALKRCDGICECGCGQPITGKVHFDHHPIAAYFDGPATLANCRVLMERCHKLTTSQQDRPRIDKARRIIEKRAGLRGNKGRGFRGWRRFDGTIVWRE